MLKNRADYSIALGYEMKNYYCGRKLGIFDIQDGRCGPNYGPQCPDCRGLQTYDDKFTVEDQLFVVDQFSRDQNLCQEQACG